MSACLPFIQKPHSSNLLLSIWRDKVILHQCVCKIIWQSSHWLFFFIGILWALQTRLVRTWRRDSCDGSLVMTVKIERIHDFQQWSLSKTVLKRPSLTEEKELLWSWDRMIWTLGGWIIVLSDLKIKTGVWRTTNPSLTRLNCFDS